MFPNKEKIDNNKLIIRLQPDEHIELVQMAKYQDLEDTDTNHIARTGLFRLLEAISRYERLLMDVVRGNQPFS